ncbi:Mediator of RNA polymerase II transcription subunit 21 [Neophaeococcomyces mojaviensis]|uniref:Mediator of RNA polymerase II transcription subunit 21 n=1 Tax=Neophaeococcomyces mojaviensis TaxID=3383035 RepID=A0ACC3ADB8_9EURO|nr:Mediator of RNA polymerase II transcription subunit 21 [Knufia sp. JES_112]
MSSDVLTQLQITYNQLMVQFFSTFSYLHQRHPLEAPLPIPGQPFTGTHLAPSTVGEEDTTNNVYPLQPQDRKVFEEAQRELAEDLVLKAQQIQQLLARLPGVDQDDEQQAEDIQKLISQVDDMEKERKAKRREMRQLVRKLETVIGGVSRSVDYNKVNGHTSRG